jgi:hypothetical protein
VRSFDCIFGKGAHFVHDLLAGQRQKRPFWMTASDWNPSYFSSKIHSYCHDRQNVSASWGRTYAGPLLTEEDATALVALFMQMSIALLTSFAAATLRSRPTSRPWRQCWQPRFSDTTGLTRFCHFDVHSAYVCLQSNSASVHDNALEFLDSVLKASCVRCWCPCSTGRSL